MTTHRVTFDLKVEGGLTEARELELIANMVDARREAQRMLFRAYRDRAKITAFVTCSEKTQHTVRTA